MPVGHADEKEKAQVFTLAVFGLILGLLGLFTFGMTSVVGVWLGVIALRRIAKPENNPQGAQFANAVILVSSGIVLFVLVTQWSKEIDRHSAIARRTQEIQKMGEESRGQAFSPAGSSLPPETATGQVEFLASSASEAGGEANARARRRLAEAERRALALERLREIGKALAAYSDDASYDPLQEDRLEAELREIEALLKLRASATPEAGP
ncbi:MAG: hypothetical protein V1918_01010 [Planctomycetota bacterium]